MAGQSERPGSNGDRKGRAPFALNVGVMGAGHVGLPTAAALAHLGHRVVATDVDAGKISALVRGVTPFFEPELEGLIAGAVKSGRLSFSSDQSRAISNADVVFICVGTPPRADGDANLLAVEQATETVARWATGDLVLVEKSTVPAGTAARMEMTLARHDPRGKISVVSSPEFLREGRAVEDSLHPGRILIGSDSSKAIEVMRRLYRPLLDQGTIWIEMDVRTAELAKHACNAFLALKISYANALARICELAGADVVSVADAMGADARIGRSYLDAGLGYGGYCFPKDLAAFRHLSGRLGYEFTLLDEVARINDEAVEAAFSKVQETLWNLEEKRVALLGLSFKPGTDDLRFAPALTLAKRLLAAGATVVGYDPQAGAAAKSEIPQMLVASDAYAALEGAHCAVVCTEWDEISRLDLARVRTAMAFPVVVDGRNVFDPEVMACAGFTYVPTGRPSGRLPVGHVPS